MNWLREMLSTPAQEFPEFPAAVSLLPLLPPEDVLHQMELRAAKLTDQIGSVDKEIQANAVGLPRLFLLESEYMRIVLEAELKWVRLVVADLRGGQLTWNEEWRQQFVPPETEE